MTRAHLFLFCFAKGQEGEHKIEKPRTFASLGAQILSSPPLWPHTNLLRILTRLPGSVFFRGSYKGKWADLGVLPKVLNIPTDLPWGWALSIIKHPNAPQIGTCPICDISPLGFFQRRSSCVPPVSPAFSWHNHVNVATHLPGGLDRNIEIYRQISSKKWPEIH